MATGTDKSIGIEISATDKTKKALTGVQKNLTKTNKKANTLSERFRNMARATAAIEGPLGGTAGRLSVIATLLGSANVAMVGFSAAMTGATLIAGLAIKRWGEFEEQTLKVEQMLKTTGGAAGLTAKEINSLADEIGEATLQSRNGALEASAVLLSFKSIAGDAFKSTMRVAADMSALMGTDLKSSVVQLGKALEDPSKGLSALSRSGISFTQTQRDMIVAMQEAGNAAGAQAEILKILEGQLGGAGAAAGGGLSGALDLVSHGWDKWLVQLADTGAGEKATAILAQIGRGMNNVANEMDDTFDTEGKMGVVLKERLALINKINAEVKKGTSNVLLILDRQRLQVLKDRADQLAFMLLDEEKASVAAKKRAAIVKQQLKDEADAVAVKTAAEKAAKEAERQKKRDVSAAGKFGEQLAKEHMQLQDSLLNKQVQEDLYLQRRLEKIRQNKEAELITKEEMNQQISDAHEVHALRQTAIDEAAAKQKLKTETAINKKITSMKFTVANQAIALVKMVAGKSKTVALAMLALEKGLAMAQVKVSTEVAAMAALMPPPVGLGPLKGKALAATVRGWGAVSMGLIAATGLAQASSLNTGGFGGGGGGSAPGTISSSQSFTPSTGLQDALEGDRDRGTTNIIFNNPELLSDGSIDRIVDKIKDSIDNRDVILITPVSRNGQELNP